MKCFFSLQTSWWRETTTSVCVRRRATWPDTTKSCPSSRSPARPPLNIWQRNTTNLSSTLSEHQQPAFCVWHANNALKYNPFFCFSSQREYYGFGHLFWSPQLWNHWTEESLWSGRTVRYICFFIHWRQILFLMLMFSSACILLFQVISAVRWDFSSEQAYSLFWRYLTTFMRWGFRKYITFKYILMHVSIYKMQSCS